jgi:hypothetical protein
LAPKDQIHKLYKEHMPELDYKVVKLNEKSQVLIDMRQNEEKKDHSSDGG